jgi:hypothetical protein
MEVLGKNAGSSLPHSDDLITVTIVDSAGTPTELVFPSRSFFM